MLDNIIFNKVLFIDIETTSQEKSFDDLSQRKQELFLKKYNSTLETKGLTLYELYDQKAPLSPEFGKVIAISVGFMHNDKFIVENYSSRDEKTLLNNFFKRYNKVFNTNTGYVVTAYNGFIFDFPFLAKRCFFNDIVIPKILNYSESKPWEIKNLIDLKKIYSYSVFDGGISLDLMCEVMDIPSSKGIIDGSKVKDFFYNEDNDYLEDISNYCGEDVVALARIFKRIIDNDFIPDNNIESNLK